MDGLSLFVCKKITGMWRLLFASVLFLLSLLGVFKAPTNFFWRVAVAVTEFPFVFTGVSLIFFIACCFSKSYKITVLVLTALAFTIFLAPIIRTYSRGSALSKSLHQIFPSSSGHSQLQKPFSFFKMFTGIGIKKVSPHTFVYKTLPEKNLTLDFYPSSFGALAPCILVIHGGSWAEGDSKQLPDLNSYLANRGYHVAAINYRLAPAHQSPAPAEDTKDALTYLIENARKLNIDTGAFVFLGRSAGAQIALVAAYTNNNPGIRGVISLYGPADMVWGARVKGNKLVLNTDKVFRDYLGGLIDEVPEKYRESSAVEQVSGNSPPTLIIHGDIDAMVSFEHSVHLNKKLDDYNVKHYFLDLPGATHGCDYNINGPSGQITTFAIERFINSVTSTP